MTKHSDSTLRRALSSLRRTLADMDHAQRRMIELQMYPTGRRDR